MTAMRRAVVVCTVAALGFAIGADNDGGAARPVGEGAFKNAKGLAARDAYLKTVADAEARYNKANADALTLYCKQLDAARAASTRAGNLEDATAIDDEFKAPSNLLREAKAGSVPKPKAKGLVIEGARWGAKGKWVDVTEAMRRSVRNDQIKDLWTTIKSSKVEDPIFGTPKTIEFYGTYGGRPFSLSVHERNSSDFHFGAPEPSAGAGVAKN